MNKWTSNEIALLKANFNVLPNQDLSNSWQNTPPLLSEAKVGDECQLFFTETIDNQ